MATSCRRIAELSPRSRSPHFSRRNAYSPQPFPLLGGQGSLRRRRLAVSVDAPFPTQLVDHVSRRANRLCQTGVGHRAEQSHFRERPFADGLLLLGSQVLCEVQLLCSLPPGRDGGAGHRFPPRRGIRLRAPLIEQRPRSRRPPLLDAEHPPADWLSAAETYRQRSGPRRIPLPRPAGAAPSVRLPNVRRRLVTDDLGPK
jgi:hypothetical protein